MTLGDIDLTKDKKVLWRAAMAYVISFHSFNPTFRPIFIELDEKVRPHFDLELQPNKKLRFLELPETDLEDGSDEE